MLSTTKKYNSEQRESCLRWEKQMKCLLSHLIGLFLFFVQKMAKICKNQLGMIQILYFIKYCELLNKQYVLVRKHWKY